MSVATVRAKIRHIIGDNAQSMSDIRTYTSSRIFSLSEERPIDVTEVYKNDVAIGESGNGFSYSSTSKKVTLASGLSLTAGDTLQFDFTFYPNYSDAELLGFIYSSIAQISINGYKTFEVISDDDINPEPTEAEENLIAVVASILIKPDNKSYKLPDLTITVPIAAMPTDEMVRRAIMVFKKNTTGVFGLIDLTEGKIW